MPFKDANKNREYQLEWYHSNKKRLGSNIKRRRADNRNLIDAYKEELGCSCNLCGVIDHPVAFDFHHINHEEKEYTVSKMAGYKWERIQKEIDKCVMVCAICHRKLHKGLLCLLDYRR
jgi:UV DNA damage repair endonuclease